MTPARRNIRERANTNNRSIVPLTSDNTIILIIAQLNASTSLFQIRQGSDEETPSVGKA